MSAGSRVGMEIRIGDGKPWGEIVLVDTMRRTADQTYLVTYPGGRTEIVPVDDPTAQYEFRAKQESTT